MPNSGAAPRRTAEQLLASIARHAAALNIAHGGSLAAPPPNLKLSLISRDLRELSALLRDKTYTAIASLAALRSSPEAFAAILQLHAAALRLASGCDDPGVRTPASPAIPPRRLNVSPPIGTSTSYAAADRGLVLAAEASNVIGGYLARWLEFYDELGQGKHQDDGGFATGLAKGLWLQCAALLRAGTLPAMSQLLTATAERERRAPRQSAPLKGPPMPPPVSVDDVGSLFGVVQAMRKVASRDYGMSAHLEECLASSRLMEHMAKAAAPAAATARAAAGVSAPEREAAVCARGAHSTAGGSSSGSSNGSSSRDTGLNLLLRDALLDLLGHLCLWADPPPAIRGVLSGPCLHYFAAAHAVSQLHAVDGGTTYGLPHSALLPAVLAPTQGCSGSTGGRPCNRRGQGPPEAFVSAESMELSVKFWQLCLATPGTLGLPHPRHVLQLCQRAARAALDSLDWHRQQRQWTEQQQRQQERSFDGGGGRALDSGGSPSAGNCLTGQQQPVGVGQSPGRQLKQPVDGGRSGGRAPDAGALRLPFQSDGCKELALTCLTTCSVVFSRHGSSLMPSSSSSSSSSSSCAGTSPLRGGSSSSSGGGGSGGGGGGGDLGGSGSGSGSGSGGGGPDDVVSPASAADGTPSCPPHVGRSTATAASFPTAAGDSGSSPSLPSTSLSLSCREAAGADAGAYQGVSPDAEGGALPAARPDPRLHHAPTAARWWPLAVRFVRAMLGSEHPKDEYWVYHSSRVLHLDGPGGQPGEPSEGPGDLYHAFAPPSGLAHALAAGYIPAYEACLRAVYATRSGLMLSVNATATAGGTTEGITQGTVGEQMAMQASSLLNSVLQAASGSKLLLLLLSQGSPREAAALGTTVCKLLLRHAQKSAMARYPGGLLLAASLASGLTRTLSRGLYEARHWSGAGCADIPVIAHGSGSVGSGDGSSGSFGVGSAGAGGKDASLGGTGPQSQASRTGGQCSSLSQRSKDDHLVQLVSYLMPRWLPALTRIGSLCLAAGLAGTATLAEVVSGRAVLKAQASFGVELCERLGDGDGEESWERVFMDMTAADMVGSGAEAASCGAVGGTGPGDAASEEAEETEAQERASEYTGYGSEEKVSEDEEQQQEDEEEQQCHWECGEERRWLRQVPLAPCYTSGLLHTCANPLCTNLDGDSEVGVVLGVAEEGDGGVVGAAMGAAVEGGGERGGAATGAGGALGTEEVGGASAGASEPGPVACGSGGEERAAVRVFCSVECRDEYREQQECVERWRKRPVCLDCRWRHAAMSAGA